MGVAHIKTVEFSITENAPYPPQGWSYDEEAKSINNIDPEHIMSYNHNGTISSRFKDDEWELMWSVNRTGWRTINFSEILDEEERKLVKRLVFIDIYFGRGKANTLNTPSTISNNYTKGAKFIALYAQKKGIKLKEFFGDKKLLKAYITSEIKQVKSRAIYVHGLLTHLLRMDHQKFTGISYEHDDNALRLLLEYYSEYKKGLKQTAVIPPTILLNAQNMRWEHIDKVLAVIPKLTILIGIIMDDPFNYRGDDKTEYNKAIAKGVANYLSFQQLIEKLGLEDFCAEYVISSRNRLKDYLSHLSRTCRHQLYGFTGMRNDEGRMVLIDCWHEKGAELFPVITSIEKKGQGIANIQEWATIDEVHKIVKVQSEITNAIASRTHPKEPYLPLFFNPDWIKPGVNLVNLEASTAIPALELPLVHSRLILTERDKKLTLEATEYDRDWDNDIKYQVGKTWNFEWRQYRRTIAVYALQNGVSLTALSKQYRHLIEATTAGYGNGWHVAQPLKGTDNRNHIAYEIDENRQEAAIMQFIRDKAFELEHPEHAYSPKLYDPDDISPENIVIDENEVNGIQQRIKNGYLSYANTALGGCTSQKQCFGHMMLLYTPCIECPDAVHNDKKINRAILVTKKYKEQIEEKMPNSVEARTMAKNVEDLEALKKQRLGVTDE